MAKTTVNYRCQHLSCRNPKCYEGRLELDQETFDLLFEAENDPRMFRSPSGRCLIGNIQQFEILSQKLEDDEKLPPATVLRMLQERLKETIAAKTKIDKQFVKLSSMQEEAQKNIEHLQERIKKTSELIEKGA